VLRRMQEFKRECCVSVSVSVAAHNDHMCSASSITHVVCATAMISDSFLRCSIDVLRPALGPGPSPGPGMAVSFALPQPRQTPLWLELLSAFSRSLLLACQQPPNQALLEANCDHVCRQSAAGEAIAPGVGQPPSTPQSDTAPEEKRERVRRHHRTLSQRCQLFTIGMSNFQPSFQWGDGLWRPQ
jgi:hypothetical protein